MADLVQIGPGETDLGKIVAALRAVIERFPASEDAAGTALQSPVANADLADMVQATVKLRAAGAGTGPPIDGTATQLLAILNTLSTIGIGAGKLFILKDSDPDEGGQFYMEITSGSSLASNVTVDIFINQFRVFENGGSARGFNVDLSACAAGAGTSLVPGIGSEILGVTAGIVDRTNSTLALSDKGVTVFSNDGAANTITVPANASVAFPLLTYINVLQAGAGQTTITAAGGVTINSYNGALKLAGLNAMGTLLKTGTDNWYAAGNLTT